MDILPLLFMNWTSENGLHSRISHPSRMISFWELRVGRMSAEFLFGWRDKQGGTFQVNLILNCKISWQSLQCLKLLSWSKFAGFFAINAFLFVWMIYPVMNGWMVQNMGIDLLDSMQDSGASLRRIFYLKGFSGLVVCKRQISSSWGLM